MTDAIGPVWVGGFEEIHVSDAGVDYVLQFLPDKNNDLLQQEGKNPVFYWLPNALRLAEKPNGDLRLSFLHFMGVQDGETNLGVAPGQTRETSGGVLSFAMTGTPPDGVLPDAHKQILDRMKNRNDVPRFWRVLENFATPSSDADIRPVPIRSSTLRVMVTDQDGAGPNTNAGDPFFVNAQGGGAGGLSPLAEHPFIVNLGTFAAAQVEQGLLSTETPVAVLEDMVLALWAPVTELHMESNWERVFEHFNVQAQARYFWAAADVKATWNTLRTEGHIKVELKMDKSIPGADNQEQMITKYIDMLVSMWLDQAKQLIFTPMPQVQDPAPPSGGGFNLFGWGFGGGVSLNFQQDRVNMAQTFDFSLDQIYPQPHTMGGSVDGVADIVAKDPSQKSKYMRKLFLDNWERKITTVCRPVVKWKEEPVKFVSVQVGYPGPDGALAFSAHDFTAPPEPAAIPTADAVHDAAAPVAETTPQAPASSPTLTYGNGTAAEVFFVRATQKALEDVTNPPDGWTPNKVFVKRTLHFDEPAAESSDQFKKTFVDVNEVVIDPGDHGSMTESLSVEVRADTAGTLALGPMRLFPPMTDATMFVEVEFQITGEPALPPRSAVRYEFTLADATTPRFLTVYTGRPDWNPGFTYQVRTLRGGSDDIEAEEWLGPVVEVKGGGELLIRRPAKTGTGVTVISG